MSRGPEPTAVLVTADDFYAALAGVRALRAGGFAPWVATHVPDAVSARSRTVAGVLPAPDPRTTTAPEFAGRIAEAVRRSGAEAVLPGTEATLVLLAGQDEALGAEVALGAPGADVVTRATDKTALAELGEGAGLRTPPTVVVKTDAPLPELDYPVIVKPLRTAMPGADGSILVRIFARYAEDADALRSTLRELGSGAWLVQQYLEGDLESVCGVAWGGEIVCAQRHVARRLWPPRTGGSAYAQSIERDPALDEAVARLLGALPWSGLFQVQLIRVGSKPYLIDLNPRMWGSLALAVAAGQNLPAIWADLVLGRRPRIGPYRVGVGFRAEVKDVRALARALFRADGRAGLGGFPPKRDTVHAVASLRDPLPLLALRGQLRRARRSPPGR